jgi:cytochrome c1
MRTHSVSSRSCTLVPPVTGLVCVLMLVPFMATAGAARQSETVFVGRRCRAPGAVRRRIRWVAGAPGRAGPRAAHVRLAARTRSLRQPRMRSCHFVRGLADTRLGPDLTQVGARAMIGAGTLPRGVGNIAGWIASAQHLKPGNAMKSYDQLEGPQAACACRVSRVAEITVRLRGDVS